MDFQTSVEFAGALIVVVGSGIFLGMGIKSRRNEVAENVHSRKALLYSEIVMSMDNLSDSSAEYKQYFVHRYYQGLVYAPDTVIKSLNEYLVAIARGDRGDKLLDVRDNAVLAMRRDMMRNVGGFTRLGKADLQTIEIEQQSAETKRNIPTKNK